MSSESNRQEWLADASEIRINARKRYGIVSFIGVALYAQMMHDSRVCIEFVGLKLEYLARTNRYVQTILNRVISLE